MPYVFGGSFRDLPDWYKATIENIAKEGESYRKQEYPRYNQPRIAEVSPFTQESYSRVGKQLGAQEPYYENAYQMLRPSHQSYQEQIAPYMNPYMRNVVDTIGSEGARTFKERILPQLEAKFIGLGQHGSSRHREMSERAARDLQNEIMKRQQEALHQGFTTAGALRGQESMRQLESARALGQLGTMSQRGALEDINILNSIGAQQQAQRQQVLNEQQAEYWRRMMWPQQQLAQQASMLHGVPMPSMQTGMSYEPPRSVPEVNRMGQMGGMASQMYGLGQQQRFFKRGGHVSMFSRRRKPPDKIGISEKRIR